MGLPPHTICLFCISYSALFGMYWHQTVRDVLAPTPASFLGATGLLGVVGMLVAAALGPGIGEWARWTETLLRTPTVLRLLVCQAVLPTVLAFYWMNTFQPRVPA